MTRFLYNLLWPFGLLVFLPGYLIKMFRRGGYRKNFGQRLGMYQRDVVEQLRRSRPIWLHAVSVGEAGIALKLASKLRELLPGETFVLTTTTTTGYAFAGANAPSGLTVIYTPLDFWPAMRRAFSVIQPRMLVLIEAELWPNMLAFAASRNIPVALANARLSVRSERRMRLGSRFVAPMFHRLDLVTVPNKVDAERWAALGVARDRIRIVGSVKFDPEHADIDSTIPREVFQRCQIDDRRPVLFAGSTHPGEEEVMADIFLRLRKEFPGLLLVIAPRHVERAGEVERMLDGRQLRVVRRSLGRSDVAPDCVLIDSTGELRHWYSVATVVFIGKTLLAHGGQNPAEAIVADKPVMFGPHMENFSDLARALVRAGGAIQAGSGYELENQIAGLLRDPNRAAEMVGRAREVLATHRGATARTAELIQNLVRSWPR